MHSFNAIWRPWYQQKRASSAGWNTPRRMGTEENSVEGGGNRSTTREETKPKLEGRVGTIPKLEGRIGPIPKLPRMNLGRIQEIRKGASMFDFQPLRRDLPKIPILKKYSRPGTVTGRTNGGGGAADGLRLEAGRTVEKKKKLVIVPNSAATTIKPSGVKGTNGGGGSNGLKITEAGRTKEKKKLIIIPNRAAPTIKPSGVKGSNGGGRAGGVSGSDLKVKTQTRDKEKKYAKIVTLGPLSGPASALKRNLQKSQAPATTTSASMISTPPSYQPMEYSFMSTPDSIVESFSPVSSQNSSSVLPTLFPTRAPAIPTFMPPFMMPPQYYFNMPFNLPSHPIITGRSPSQLFIPSPPPSPAAPPVSLSTFPQKEKNLQSLHKIRPCQVHLKKLQRSEIEKHQNQPRHQHRRSVASPGKQIHLLKQLLLQRPHGRPKKKSGQCQISTKSDSSMKIKIVKVPEDTSSPRSGCSSFPAVVNQVDVQAASATAASVVQSGFFDKVLMKKTSPKKSAAPTSRKVIMAPGPKSRKIAMTPREGKGQGPAAGSSYNSYFSRFSSRSVVSGQKDEWSRRETPAVLKEPKRTLDKVTTEKKRDAKNWNPNARKDSTSGDVADSGIVDDGWVTALLSTNLATEVVNEALDDSYMPDISVIQGLTEDDILSDLFGPSASADIPAMITSVKSPDTGLVSSSTMSPFPKLSLIDEAEDSDNDPVFIEEVLPKNPPVKRQPEFYEELYNNDILLIDAEDEELPLP